MPLFKTKKIFIISLGSFINDVISFLGQGGGEGWGKDDDGCHGVSGVKFSIKKSKDDVIFGRASCIIFCFNRSEDYLTFLLLACFSYGTLMEDTRFNDRHQMRR